MGKQKYNCSNCDKELWRWPSQAKTEVLFCCKSCQMSHRNRIDNPSWKRDLSGENNPMYGKHPVAWNKGMKGERAHNWKGGIHKRKDGYVRINIDGKRHLLHRHVVSANQDIEGKVIHHKDHDPSNNDPDNLMIFDSQAEHVKYEREEQKRSDSVDAPQSTDTDS